MDGEPTFPAGSRRARVALLVAGAVVQAAATVGVRAVLGADGGQDRPPGEAAGVAAAGTTIGGKDTNAPAGGGGGSGGPAATGAGVGGGSGGRGEGGTPRTTTSRPTTTAATSTTSYDIPVRYAFDTVHVKLDDTVKGNAASPTETVVDRLHVFAPPDLNGQPFTATMVHTICT